MKFKLHLLLFLIVAFSSTEFLNAQTVRENLIGTWTLNYETTKLEIDQGLKDKFNNVINTKQQQIEVLYKDRKITFEEDDTFILTLADGRQAKGEWQLGNNKKSIEITYTNETTQFLKISSLDSQQLVLKPKGNPNQKSLFKKSYFTKN